MGERPGVRQLASAGRPRLTGLTDKERTELVRLLPAYTVEWLRGDRAPDGTRIGLDPHPPAVHVSALKDVAPSGGAVFVGAYKAGLDCAGSEYEVTLSDDSRPVATESGVTLIC